MGAQDIDKPGTNLSKEESVEVLKWYLEITEKGIEKIGDSVIYSKEFIKVLNNEEYRSFIFPKEYKREVAASLIDNKNLKQAFWYLINIYPQNENTKEIVIQSVIAYDKVFKMDEVLVNTFYTYSFMDPEISVIKDGKPEIVRPDILEAKLANVKEMVAYIVKYRKQQETKKKSE
jgi:hypothetical protein